MSIDISSDNYNFDIGNSKDIEYLKQQTKGKPIFTKLWKIGKLSSLEAELLRNECLDIKLEFLTSSGKNFFDELLKLIADSISSGEDIIVHGIYQNYTQYNVCSQTFWGKTLKDQEVIINAIAPEGMSTGKWEMINVGLADDFNSNIKYSPILISREIVGIKCGIYIKDLDKKSLWNDLRGMIVKLSTYKFRIVLDKTNDILNKENFEELIQSNFIK